MKTSCLNLEAVPHVIFAFELLADSGLLDMLIVEKHKYDREHLSSTLFRFETNAKESLLYFVH